MFIPHYKCAWERYLINHKTGVHIIFGFLLFKINVININWNVNVTKYHNPHARFSNLSPVMVVRSHQLLRKFLLKNSAF